MDTFVRFLYEFVRQIFSGFVSILQGLINGIKQICNFTALYNIISEYKNDFTAPEWILVALTIITLKIR